MARCMVMVCWNIQVMIGTKDSSIWIARMAMESIHTNHLVKFMREILYMARGKDMEFIPKKMEKNIKGPLEITIHMGLDIMYKMVKLIK